MKLTDLSPRMSLIPASQELTVDFVAGGRSLGENVGGLQAFSDRMVRGYGDKVFGTSNDGIWLGKADFSTAPFKVDMDGKVTMTQATITGYTKDADVVTIIGNTVNATYVNALNIQASTVKSDWVYAGNLSANQITAGSLSADRITTGSMSAERITSGTMSASRISGGTLTLGGSSNGNGVMYLNNSSNQNAVYFDKDGIVFWDDRASNVIAWGTSGGTLHGFVGYTGGAMWLGTDDGKSLYVSSDSGLYLEASGAVNLSPGGTNKIECNKNVDMNENNIDGANTVYAYNFTNRSDIRLKKNVADMAVDIDDIFRLIPVVFNYKHEEQGVKRHYGFIAQEVEAVYPNLITVDEDGSKAINYNELLAILFAMTKKIADKVYGSPKITLNRADESKLPELKKKEKMVIEHPKPVELPDFSKFRKNLKITVKKADDLQPDEK